MTVDCPVPLKRLGRRGQAGFTLIEITIALLVLGIVLAGLLYGYVQANWTAEWSSMSLAAQSYAMQGAEQARAADWRPRDWPPAIGAGTMDELTNGSVIVNVDFMDIPSKGKPGASDFNSWVTNIVTVTNISVNPPLRQIRSDAIWTFPVNGTVCTNTIILLRASDQ